MSLGGDILLKRIQGRLTWLTVLMALLCVVLVSRLFYLQVVKHAFYTVLAHENKIVSEIVPGDRGMILDRFGHVIVDNRPAWNVYLLPDSFLAGKREDEKRARAEATIERLAEILQKDTEEIWEMIRAGGGRLRFRPVLVKADAAWDEISAIEEINLRANGVFVRTEPVREYKYHGIGAHFMGYIHEVSGEQLKELKKEYPDHGYRQGNLVGQQGIEKLTEPWLRGRDGYRELIVNAYGGEVDEAVLKELGFDANNEKPVPGNNIVLTLDWELQLTAEETLGGEHGAIAAMDPRTGEVLALVSHPTFDPNQFARGISQAEYDVLRDAPGKPLYSKVIQGQYPPGSTWKPFVAMAGLEEGIIDGKEFEPVCHGRYRVGKRWFHCWRRGGHGKVDLLHGLKQSCDVFFYQLGLELGIDRIAKYAKLFGFGERTGIGFDEEKSGLVPTEAWKLRVKKEPWQAGETLPCVIGQGFNLVTPIQLVRATSAIANGGTLVQPYLIARAQSVDGAVIHEFAPKIPPPLPFKPEHIGAIHQGLVAVVHAPDGTGRRAQVPGIQVAGKTGTAQVVNLSATEHYKNDDDIPKEFRDHALFIAYAPAEDPYIAIAVIVEHGGGGGKNAAPVAQKIIARYKELREQRQSAGLPVESQYRYAAHDSPSHGGAQP